MHHSDRPRRIQKKEIAAEIGIHPATLSRFLRAGLVLPIWPCTMADCVGAVRCFRAEAALSPIPVK